MYDAVATKMLLDLLTLIFELGDMHIKWHSVNPYTKFENPSCHYPYSSDEGFTLNIGPAAYMREENNRILLISDPLSTLQKVDLEKRNTKHRLHFLMRPVAVKMKNIEPSSEHWQ